MSVDISIYLYSIKLFWLIFPLGVAYCHLELPAISINDTVLYPFNIEKTWSIYWFLPKANPRWPLLVVPDVCLIQISDGDKVRGLNLNKN
jgi:hypothetical protein